MYDGVPTENFLRFIFIYVHMYVYTLHVCLVPMEARRGTRSQFLGTIGTELRSFARASALKSPHSSSLKTRSHAAQARLEFTLLMDVWFFICKMGN